MRGGGEGVGWGGGRVVRGGAMPRSHGPAPLLSPSHPSPPYPSSNHLSKLVFFGARERKKERPSERGEEKEERARREGGGDRSRSRRWSLFVCVRVERRTERRGEGWMDGRTRRRGGERKRLGAGVGEARHTPPLLPFPLPAPRSSAPPHGRERTQSAKGNQRKNPMSAT